MHHYATGGQDLRLFVSYPLVSVFPFFANDDDDLAFAKTVIIVRIFLSEGKERERRKTTGEKNRTPPKKVDAPVKPS